MEGTNSTGTAFAGHKDAPSNPDDSNPPQLAPAATEDDGSDFYNTSANTSVDPIPNSTLNNSEPATTHPSVPMIPGLGLFNVNQSPTHPEKPAEAPQGNSDGVDDSSKQEVGSKDMTTNGGPGEVDGTKAVATDTEMKDANLANGNATEQGINTIQKEEKMGVDRAHIEQIGPNGIVENGAPAGDTGENNVEMGDHPEWEVDSSPYESSSDDTSSDSSSDDSDSDDDDDDYAMLDPEEQARILMQAEGGSDNEGEGKGQKSGGGHIKSTNERPEEIVPKPDITVTPDMKVEFLGKVETAVDNVILIRANISGEYQVLETGSVLCLEDRAVIGVVSETLGQVQQPLYTVRFASAAAMEEAGLRAGTTVYYVVTHSTFVFTQPLKGLKGSDASNFHDEEAGEDEIEFSDDEAEAQYKRQIKQKRQERKEARGQGKPRRGELHRPSNLGTIEMNYDVEQQDGYTPLVRPKNLHEMMGQQEPFVEGHQVENRSERPPERGSRGRGRGRGGYDRGRGRGNRGNRGGGGRYMHQQQSRGDYQQRSSQDRNQENPYSQQPMHQLPQPPKQTPEPYNNQQQFSNNQPSYQPQQPFPFNNFLPTNTAPQYSPPAQYPPQQNSFPQPPPGSHINPAFFPTMQQPQPQSQSQNQSPVDPFAAAQAQLDLLRRLSGFGYGGSGAGGGGQDGGQGNSG